MTTPLPNLPYLGANGFVPDKYLSVNIKKTGGSVNGVNIINQNLNTAPSGSVGFVRYVNGAWPARPTNRTDIIIFWLGPSMPTSANGALATDQWIDVSQ